MNERRPSGVERAWRLGSATFLALLALGCEGDNLFQPGPGRGPDSRAPEVEIQEPRDPAANPIGHPHKVHMHIPMAAMEAMATLP